VIFQADKGAARKGRIVQPKNIADLSSDFSQHWRDNSPSQAIVRKANQKIKETNF